MVQQDGLQLDQEWGIIHVGDDSEPEYGVMAIDVVKNQKRRTLKGRRRKT